MTKIVVKGASGKMGTRIIALARVGKNFSVVETIESAEVMIDFSHPDATLSNLEQAARVNKPAVIGTTGHTPDQLEKIRAYGKKIPLVLSSNMSVGVNVLWKVIEMVAQTVPDFQVKVSETHHIHKKDAPSGTAKTMIEILARALGTTPDKIPVESKREREVVGDHTALFIGEEERLEITHHAESRDIFARGALRAAGWLVGRPNGLYSMADVLFS